MGGDPQFLGNLLSSGGRAFQQQQAFAANRMLQTWRKCSLP